MSRLMIMSLPFRVGRHIVFAHIVFARVACPSICVHHKIVSIEQFKLLGSSNLYPKTLYTIVLVFKQHVLRRNSVTICMNTKHQSIAKHFHVHTAYAAHCIMLFPAVEWKVLVSYIKFPSRSCSLQKKCLKKKGINSKKNDDGLISL